MNLTPALEQSFWNGVDKSAGEDACWNWTRGKIKKGYGGFYLGGIRKQAHHIALELSGVIIPENAMVLHSCDNPGCCNPKHLSIGNNSINQWERSIRNRCNATCGEKQHKAKLTEEQVCEIRKRYCTENISFRSLASLYAVNETTIQRIIQRKTWKHV